MSNCIELWYTIYVDFLLPVQYHFICVLYTEVKLQKKGEKDVKSSKTCYGMTYIENAEIPNGNLNHRIELEYYRIKKKKHHLLKENTETYGIEVVKKEYKGHKVNIEKEKVEKISNKKANIDSILNILKEFQVTPVALKDVIDDMMHT